MRDVEKGGVEKRETWVGDVADDGGDDQVAGRWCKSSEAVWGLPSPTLPLPQLQSNPST